MEAHQRSSKVYFSGTPTSMPCQQSLELGYVDSKLSEGAASQGSSQGPIRLAAKCLTGYHLVCSSILRDIEAPNHACADRNMTCKLQPRSRTCPAIPTRQLDIAASLPSSVLGCRHAAFLIHSLMGHSHGQPGTRYHTDNSEMPRRPWYTDGHVAVVLPRLTRP